MRSEGKKRTLELSLIQGFSCVKSIYVLSLVVPPGIEPGTQGFSVLSLKTFKSLAYGSTFKGNQLSYGTMFISFAVAKVVKLLDYAIAFIIKNADNWLYG